MQRRPTIPLFLRVARALGLLASATVPACAASVNPDGGRGDVTSESVVPIDALGADTLIADAPGVDAGAGCPAQLPMTGQTCSRAMTCDYSAGQCVTDRDVYCRCVPEPSGALRWQCAPNCDIGPLPPPELA